MSFSVFSEPLWSDCGDPTQLVNTTHPLKPLASHLDAQPPKVQEASQFLLATAKHEAAKRWAKAVNNWGRLGKWTFHVCKDPQMLGRESAHLVKVMGG
jgi:hypothetical protein